MPITLGSDKVQLHPTAEREPRKWYRNAGARTYHRAAPRWVHTGRADCGADIGNAGYSSDTPKHIATLSDKRVCTKCLKVEE